MVTRENEITDNVKKYERIVFAKIKLGWQQIVVSAKKEASKFIRVRPTLTNAAVFLE